MFTDKESEFLGPNGTGRLATLSRSRQPDVAPVGYLFDGKTFTVWGGTNMAVTLKYLNTKQRSDRTAFVVDDYEAGDYSRPRGLKIHCLIEIVDDGDGEKIRLTPERKWSWGINAAMFQDGQRVIERTSGAGG